MKKYYMIVFSCFIFFFGTISLKATSNIIYWSVDGENCDSRITSSSSGGNYNPNCTLILSNNFIDGNHYASGIYDNSEVIPWLKYYKIYKVEIGKENDIISPTNLRKWFFEMNYVEDIDFSYLDTSKVRDMSYMFYGMSSLTHLDLSNFNTSNVIDMSYMFDGCSKLEQLDLNSFNTSNVTTMRMMFSRMESLANLDLSNFDMTRVTSVAYMFDGCTNLRNVNLNSFNSNSITDMNGTFRNLKSLKTIDLSSFNTSLVEDMDGTFEGCSNLETLDLSSFNTSLVKYMDNMFAGCSKLTELDISNFNISRLCSANDIFANMDSLTTLNISNLNFSKVENSNKLFSDSNIEVLIANNIIFPSDTTRFFSDMKNLKSISLKNVDTSNVTNMSYMFSGLESLNALDLSGFNTSSVVDMRGMFYGMNSLKKLNISNFNTSNVTNMSFMFEMCSSLENLDLSAFNTSKVTNMLSMFYGCSSLTSLDLSNFNTSKVTNMSGMFAGDKNITILNISNFDTSSVVDTSGMFHSMSSLANLDISNFNTSNVVDMSAMFYDMSSLTNLDISNFDTSNVINMSYMFYDLELLENIDLSNFITSKVTDMSYMFAKCTNIRSLDLSILDTSSVVNMSGMFAYMNSINELDLSNFNTEKLLHMDRIIYMTDNLKLLNISNLDFKNLEKPKSLDLWPFIESGVETIIANNLTFPVDSSRFFCECKKLKTIYLDNVNTQYTTNMSSMFANLEFLESIDLTSFNTSNVTDMSYMFNRLLNVKKLDLSSFDTQNVRTMSYMFWGDTNLEVIRVSDNWNTPKSSSMFKYDEKIIGQNGTKYKESSLDYNYAHVDSEDSEGYFWNKDIDIALIELVDKNVTLKKGEKKELHFVYYPTFVEQPEFDWESSNDDIIVVNNGIVTAKNDGEAIISILSKNGVRTSSNIIVDTKLIIPIVNINKGDNNSIIVTWNNQQNADMYSIYLSTNKKKWKEIGDTVDNNYNVLNLIYGTTYYFKVIAKNQFVKTDYSNVVKMKVVPNKVTGLKIVNANSTSIKTEWEKVNVTGYEVYYGTSTKKMKKATTISKNGTLTYNKTKLKANTTYYFKVRAYKTVSGKKVYGPYSDVISTKTAPSTPSISVSVKDYKTLSVKINSVKGATNYILEKSLDKKTYEVAQELPASGTLAVTDLTAGTTYYFRLKVCNNLGNCSAYSKVMSKKVVPATPSLSVSSPVTKQVLVKVNAQEGAVGYEIYRSNKKNKGFKLISTLTNEDEVLEYLDATAKKKTYYYKVRTYVLNGETKVYSSYSGVKKIKSK